MPPIPPLTKASTEPKPQGTRSTYSERIRLGRVHRPGATSAGAAPLHSLHGGRRSLLPHDRAHTAPPAALWYSMGNTSAHFCGAFFFFLSFFSPFLPSPSLHNKLELHFKDCKKHRGEAEESVSCYLGTLSIF